MSATHRRFLIGCAAIPVLILLIVTVLAPVLFSLYRPVTPETEPASTASESGIPVTDLPEGQRALFERVRSLETDRIFWRSRLELAKADSFYLVLDLVDSVLILELKGVVIRRCAIPQFDVNPAIKRIRDHQAWPPVPFILSKTWATTPKTSIRIQYAPADSSAAAAAPTLPPGKALDTTQDVVLFFEFVPELSLFIKPDTPLSFSVWFDTAWHRMMHRTERIGQEVTAMVGGTLPPPDRQIALTLSSADALAIYRAIPGSVQMIIRV